MIWLRLKKNFILYKKEELKTKLGSVSKMSWLYIRERFNIPKHITGVMMHNTELCGAVEFSWQVNLKFAVILFPLRITQSAIANALCIPENQ